MKGRRCGVGIIKLAQLSTIGLDQHWLDLAPGMPPTPPPGSGNKWNQVEPGGNKWN